MAWTCATLEELIAIPEEETVWPSKLIEREHHVLLENFTRKLEEFNKRRTAATCCLCSEIDEEWMQISSM